ncbi:MAG TPA: glycoside hydrolase family 172 protein [Kribbella sp.]|uniref:glycoside hydrolase family 172 protein n=1 Tax=Kribbella sp. TaxID=1871183 RepID=UPI002D780599|nr:glycoside hydrolase family 172 protein [Kribbella sp.]HET6298457.1 glycoside hydrolase family 172 protein [Kribbella sp.]
MILGVSRLTDGRTRSVSPENPTGAKGAGGAATEGTGANAARDLGQGWKVSPSIGIPAGATAVLADLEGPGTIRHLWLTTRPVNWRSLILRIHWEGSATPAVAVPLGDFFCQGWGEFAQVSSLPVAVNPNGGFNCYWEMPYLREARISLENIGPEAARVYFQVDYELGVVDDDPGYLHATWRRSNPLPYQEVHTILDGVTSGGHYVGTYLAWGVNNSGWWGEGELKFYLDGDEEFPTICGTGTEDYFGGAWNFDVPGQGYTAYTTPFLGLPQILRPDGLYRSQQRFGMYRWHLADPIRFGSDLRVDVQALGWRQGGRYLPLCDDIASTAWWYQREPAGIETTFDPDHLEIT